MKLRITTALIVLLAGCSAIAHPNSLQAGEEYTASFSFEGHCPPGTMFQLSPVTDRPITPGNVTVRFYVNEVVSNEYPIEFDVTAGRAYDLRLVQPGMENSSTVWVATTRNVVFKNEDNECAFNESAGL